MIVTYNVMPVGVILLCLLVDDFLLDLQPLLVLLILRLQLLDHFIFLFELGLLIGSLPGQPCIDSLVVDLSEFFDLIPELMIFQSHARVFI